jgi:hypothetical protein
MAVKAKYFRFLDTAVDVYFGIILFTLFLSFPGFAEIPQTILFFHLMFFMMFTWWELRTVEQIPKHYFVDFIILGLEMFVLTQAISYLSDPAGYLAWLIAFLAMDMLDTGIDWFLHKPGKSEKRFLAFFLIDDGILIAFYIAAFLLVDELSILSAIAISLPFIASVFFSIMFRTTELKARYPS